MTIAGVSVRMAKVSLGWAVAGRSCRAPFAELGLHVSAGVQPTSKRRISDLWDPPTPHISHFVLLRSTLHPVQVPRPFYMVLLLTTVCPHCSRTLFIIVDRGGGHGGALFERQRLVPQLLWIPVRTVCSVYVRERKGTILTKRRA